MATKAKTTKRESFLPSKIQDYKQLVKFRLSLLVVFSAGIAYTLGAESLDWTNLLLLCLGGFLVTGAANTLNQVLEREYDCLMPRTANRPLAANRMESSEAVLFAGLMSVIGIIILAYFNVLTALLGSISLVSYAFIYTPMKRVSPIAVWIGSIPGALPMSIGWVAATGQLGAEALFLFSIQFFWQFPHFWSIAWVAYEDYAKAGFYLLPSRQKDGRGKSTAAQITFYALCLIPISFIPYTLGMTGYVAVVTMLIMALMYLFYSVNLYLNCNRRAALRLMFSSFIYLPIVLVMLLVDKI